MLELESVSLSFGPVKAVNQVSLTVPEGEVLAVLGPSGCGKSSLLRMVAGLQKPTSGKICWRGQDLSEVSVADRGFGLMFQEGQLFPNRNVAGNVAYPMQIKSPWLGRWRRPKQAAVSSLLELVGLKEYENRSVHTLSGGQAQRVALARCLAMNPQMLLLDEPLSALDQGWKQSLIVQLQQVIREKAITSLYVTHDQSEAFAIADRVAIMKDGCLLTTQKVSELCARPQTVQIAKFLGYGPFLGKEAAAKWGFDIRADQVLALAPGAFKIVGERSDHAGVADRTVAPESRPTQRVTVGQKQVSGLGLKYQFKCGKETAWAHYQIGDGNSWEEAPTGQQITVYLDPLKVHYLPKDAD